MQVFAMAAAGMMSAVNRFDASTLRAASGNFDVASEVANQSIVKTQFEASVGAMKVASEMTNALLDITV